MWSVCLGPVSDAKTSHHTEHKKSPQQAEIGRFMKAIPQIMAKGPMLWPI